MAKLKAKQRNALPSSDFGDPEDRKYPMPDKSHAANAKARVADKSPALKAKVDAKADRVLGKGREAGDGRSPPQVLKAKDGMTKVPGGAIPPAKKSPSPKEGPIDKKTLGSMVESLKR